MDLLVLYISILSPLLLITLSLSLPLLVNSLKNLESRNIIGIGTENETRETAVCIATTQIHVMS